MIIIDIENKTVVVSESEGDIVKVDGNEFQLTDGHITIVNLPSINRVEVFKKIEEAQSPETENNI